MATVNWKPIGDTATLELVPSTGTDHYPLVTDADDGTYCRSNSLNSWQDDFYTTDSGTYPVPAGATSISLTVTVRCSYIGQTGSSIKAAIKVGGNPYYGSAHAPTEPTNYNEVWATNPAGGNWTPTTINAVILGISCQGADTPGPPYPLTTIIEESAVVTYTPAASYTGQVIMVNE